MEDSPLFNARAVFSNAGRIELDASIMDGTNTHGGVRRLGDNDTQPDPRRACGDDAMPACDVDGPKRGYLCRREGPGVRRSVLLLHRFRWNQLQKAIAQERLLQDHDVIPDMPAPDANEKTDEKRGTVGAVTLDRQGNLACGITNKRFGRVGDSPIIR